MDNAQLLKTLLEDHPAKRRRPSVEDYSQESTEWERLDRADIKTDLQSVTLSITTFNSAQTLQDTLDSVRALDDVNVEILVADGGSTDDTLAIVKKNADVVSWVRSAPDRGMYDGFNIGMAKAAGNLTRILNSDDLIPKRAIGLARDIFAERGYDFILKGDLETIDEQGTILERLSANHKQKRMPQGFPIMHPTWFVPKSIYQKHGLYCFDYRISGDTEYMHWLLSQGVKVVHMPEVLALFRTRGRSANVVAPTLETLDINLRYLGRKDALALFAEAAFKKTRRKAIDMVLREERLRTRIKEIFKKTG